MVEEVYKIVTVDEWELAVREGRFLGSGIDLKDGFIHLSTRQQVQETVDRYFDGQSGLLLVALKSKLLGPSLRWEQAMSNGQTPSDREGLFPHLYGMVSMDVVAWVDPIQQDDDGRNFVIWKDR